VGVLYSGDEAVVSRCHVSDFMFHVGVEGLRSGGWGVEWGLRGVQQALTKSEREGSEFVKIFTQATALGCVISPSRNKRGQTDSQGAHRCRTIGVSLAAPPPPPSSSRPPVAKAAAAAAPAADGWCVAARVVRPLAMRSCSSDRSHTITFWVPKYEGGFNRGSWGFELGWGS